MSTQSITRHPEWLKKKVFKGGHYDSVKEAILSLSLNTVCTNARCPNIFECFSRNHLTFLIMGSRCSRSCSFCSVYSGGPEALDGEEPYRVAEAVERLGLDRVILTSVTRDDLVDGGADHFRRTVEEIRLKVGGVTIELLIPDLKGDRRAIEIVARCGADIIGHNMETVMRLYKSVRPQSDYERSLGVLRRLKEINRHIYTKSAIMVGLGERYEEVLGLIKDLRSVSCDILAIGQYLRPDGSLLPVERFVTPAEFERYRDISMDMGFKEVASAPFVRSSYMVGDKKMSKEIKLPELAEGVSQATVSMWHFKKGDNVNEGDDLVEMVTDKATFNVPVSATGILKEAYFEEGDVVKVGDILAAIEEEG